MGVQSFPAPRGMMYDRQEIYDKPNSFLLDPQQDFPHSLLLGS